MSRKSVPVAAPADAVRRGSAGARSSPRVIDAGLDEWVSDRNDGTKVSPSPFLIDLAAERSLVEVAMLGALAPLALGWFWWLNAISGRVRI